MHYPDSKQIRVGDHVVADGMNGIVVCDFDNRMFQEGYESWDVQDLEMGSGGKLSSGILIQTDEAGLVHYEDHASGEVRPRG